MTATKNPKQSKSDYVKHRERNLKEKQSSLVAMRSKAPAEHGHLVQRVEHLLGDTGKQLRSLALAVEDDWEDLRTGVDKAFGDLEAAFYELSSKIRLP